jgi:hypothetical protein
MDFKSIAFARSAIPASKHIFVADNHPPSSQFATPP